MKRLEILRRLFDKPLNITFPNGDEVFSEPFYPGDTLNIKTRDSEGNPAGTVFIEVTASRSLRLEIRDPVVEA
jgi:hypothetical protein